MTDIDRPSTNEDETPHRRLDSACLVAGLLFLGMALAFAIADLDTIEDQVRYVWPTALLTLGVGLLLGTRDRS